MIKNYFLIAWRNLQKNRFFTLVNITGLSVGLAFVLLIAAYAWGEWQVNTHFKYHDRIMMLQSKWTNPDMGNELTTIGPLAKALQENYPSLVSSWYRNDGITSIVTVGDKHFRESLQPGDSTFLTIFNFELSHGDARTALIKPNAVVLTEHKARQFFGTADVLGKTVNIQSFDGMKQDFEVTGVMKDPPFNTVTGFALPANEIFLAPGSAAFFGRETVFDNWGSRFTISYVLLQPGVTAAQLQQPIVALLKTNTTADVYKNVTVTPIRLDKYYMQMNNGLAGKMILVLSAVSLFILLMAIINFVNISMGNSLSRLKEIGVRKAMGGRKQQLILQFMTESVLVASFAFVVAIILFVLLRPMFGQVLQKEIPGLDSFPVWFSCFPLLIILFTGLLAGAYPSFVLSAQPSVTALRGKLQHVQEKLFFRRALVIGQFVTAIVVFIAAIVINQQVSFFFNKNLGYNKDHVLTAPVPRDWTPQGVKHMDAVRNEFATMPELTGVSYSYEIPNGNSNNANMVYRPQADSSSAITAISLSTDEQFIQTYGIKMEAGSFFYQTPDKNADSTKLVINEAAVKALGWRNAQEAINQPVRMYGMPQTFYIAGVTRDFHFGSLHMPIAPATFSHTSVSNIYRYLSFRLKPGNPGPGIAALQRKWSTLFPDAPFAYKFLDDTIGALYTTEMQMRKAAQLATVVSLLIVFLGVLGIVTLSIARRNKEMGIRKILGASVYHIISLFAREFSFIIIAANLLAWPLSWYILRRWLMNYAYRIEIGVMPFIVVGTALILLVCITVLGMTRRLAVTNPVKSLRAE